MIIDFSSSLSEEDFSDLTVKPVKGNLGKAFPREGDKFPPLGRSS